jgi:hypothetical protein
MALSKQDYLDILQNSQYNIGTLYRNITGNGGNIEIIDNLLQVIHHMQRVADLLSDELEKENENI